MGKPEYQRVVDQVSSSIIVDRQHSHTSSILCAFPTLPEKLGGRDADLEQLDPVCSYVRIGHLFASASEDAMKYSPTPRD
jgi:hypothetical protein